jgi:hypothetical protein
MNRNIEILKKFIGEQNQRIQNDISKQGYKDDSPYKNNPFNIIQGTSQGTPITMKGVSTPLIGMDEFGNKQYMQPGQEYQFPGSQVTETPAAKYGGLLNKTITCSNCGWSWKAADGGNDVSTCHKCGNENIIMQTGGTKKPIYVESKDDPRYLAYKDSLTLHRVGADWYNNDYRKKSMKNNPLLKGKDITLSEEEITRSLKNKPTGKRKMISDGDMPYSVYKDTYDNGKLVETKYIKTVTPKGKIYYKDTYTAPQQQVIVKPKEVKPKEQLVALQPMSVGLQDINNGFETNLDIPTPVQRQPKGYKFRSVEGGNETSGYINSPEELKHYQELQKLYSNGETKNWLGTPNSIEIIPQYQMGGKIYPFNYIPQAQDGEIVGDAGQELIDYLQRYSRYTKGMPGIGSAIGITQSLANREDMKASDKLGLFPDPYMQAASLTALYAEKEKQNLEDYAKRQLKHNSFSKLLEEKTNKQLVNDKKVDHTYVPKPKVEKVKPKVKPIPYVEHKDINPVVIDNTAVGRSRKEFQDGGLLKDLPKVNSFYKKPVNFKKETRNVVKDKTAIKSVINERLVTKELNEINNNQQKIKDAKDYYKKYLNSPKAKERISNMIDYKSDPEYDRLFPEEKNNAVDQEIKNRLAGLNKLKGKFDYINDVGTDSSSYYDPATNMLNVRPNSDANISFVNGDEHIWNNKIDLPNTIGHEIGHGIQRVSNKDSNNIWYRNGLSKKESDLLMKANIGLIGSKNRDEILKDEDNPEYKYELDHDNKPSELKADIDALRYQLYRQGVYDAGTQDFTREHLEKAKPSFTKNRLNKHFTDDELIDLMNKLSYEYNTYNTITPIAQRGGSFSASQNGMQTLQPGEKFMTKKPSQSNEVFKILSDIQQRKKLAEQEESARLNSATRYDKKHNAYILPEVVVKGKPKQKGFWEQSRDTYLEDHKDDGLFGALGSVVTYPLGLPKQAMMYGLSGKVQEPSEALGVRKGNEGVGGHALNLVADPLLFASEFAKVPELLNSAKNIIRTSEEANALINAENFAKQVQPFDPFKPLNNNSLNTEQRIVHTLDDSEPVIESISNLNNSSKIKEFFNKPRFNYTKQVLPENLEFKVSKSKFNNKKSYIDLVDPKTKKTHANITVEPHDSEWLYPNMIEVNKNLQGNKLQDVLYQKAIEVAKADGYKGVRSGDHLLSPEKTLKAHSRFEKELLEPSNITRNTNIQISGLLQHENPKVVEDFFEHYKTLPKSITDKHSVNDLFNMFSEHIKTNKQSYALGALGVPTLAGMTDLIGIPMFKEDYTPYIIDWSRKQDEKNKLVSKKALGGSITTKQKKALSWINS